MVCLHEGTQVRTQSTWARRKSDSERLTYQPTAQAQEVLKSGDRWEQAFDVIGHILVGVFSDDESGTAHAYELVWQELKDRVFQELGELCESISAIFTLCRCLHSFEGLGRDRVRHRQRS